MNVTSKALYMPLSVATSVAGGLLAGAVFNQVWKRLGDDGQPPPDRRISTGPLGLALSAAALQGLVFGLVRAAVDRAGARGYRAVTHQSPT